MKKILLFALCLLTLLSCAAAEENELTCDVLRGYDKKLKYQYVTFGNYPYEADETVKPILWRILSRTGDQAYLLTESVIDFYFTNWDSEGYYEAKNWINSDLYNYLQNDLADRAFTAGEKAALIEDAQDGSKVAVLHVDDVRNEKYGFVSNGARQAWGTPYARTHTLSLDVGGRIRDYHLYYYKDKSVPWFLREKSTEAKMQQREVLYEGKLGRVGCTNADVGIRPCIILDLTAVTITCGSGTKDDPYMLAAINEPVIEEVQPIIPDTVETDLPETVLPETEAAIDEGEAAIPETVIEATDETAADEQTGAAEADQAEDAAAVEAAGDEETEQTETADADAAETAAEESGTAAVAETAETPAVAGSLNTPEEIGADEHFPPLTKEGFLPEGETEFVLQDEENGLWLYCSQTLRVEIRRFSGTTIFEKKEKVIRWYEAQIYTKDDSEVFDLYAYDESKYTNIYTLAMAEDMAKQHQLVFSLNSDFFIYRVTRDKEESYIYPIGTEIRNGTIMYTQTRSSKSYVYPPLDVLALYADGDMRVFPNKLLYDSDYRAASVVFEGETYTFKSTKGNNLNGRQQAEQAIADMILATGATDTLCFGPILVSNGEKADTKDWGSSLNPRTAIGMVEKGHYVSVVVEGRLGSKNISYGVDCSWLVDKMYDLGCEVAFNLDGGATTAMMFMGKQISVSGDYGNGLNERKQNELLGIGHSELIN